MMFFKWKVVSMRSRNHAFASGSEKGRSKAMNVDAAAVTRVITETMSTKKITEATATDEG